VGSTRERCEAGCWTRRGVCLDGGVNVCNPGGAPLLPVDACESDVDGVMICPAGTSSGYGYQCTPTGCWTFFFDGPCSAPLASDAGTNCPFAGQTCSTAELGQERCENRVRQRCGGPGCWTNVGLCPRDGG
jgi:hypothetical protein